jgi:septal ring factor EnvC (AmiA/AmiB activator)
MTPGLCTETVDEQKRRQEELNGLERQQRRQRQEIFDVEDEIEEKRDRLIEALERRPKQRTRVHPLFRIRWQIVKKSPSGKIMLASSDQAAYISRSGIFAR